MKLSNALFILAISVSYSQTSVASRCVLDTLDTPRCSQYQGGGAIKDSLGTVRCGKGECAIDGLGNVRCSDELGGGVIKDSLGTVRCTGSCEIGSPGNCIIPGR